jgi:uncharacterized protein YutD
MVDGEYVSRTTLPIEVLNKKDYVRLFKRVSLVEKAFWSMKTEHLKVRTKILRLGDRIKIYLFFGHAVLFC